MQCILNTFCTLGQNVRKFPVSDNYSAMLTEMSISIVVIPFRLCGFGVLLHTCCRVLCVLKSHGVLVFLYLLYCSMYLTTVCGLVFT